MSEKEKTAACDAVAGERAQDKKNTGITNIFVLIMSLVFIGMAALMIFVPGIEISYLCYGICVAAIIIGIYFIVRYFMTDAYKNMNAYGFSGGTLLVILGICGVIRAEKMAGAFLVILGIILLLSGVFVLQHSLDLHRLDDIVWMPAMIIAILILICSVMVIIEPFADKISYAIVSWWMIMIGGGLGVLINIYTMIKVALFRKKEKKAAEETSVKPEEKAADINKNIPADDISVLQAGPDFVADGSDRPDESVDEAEKVSSAEKADDDKLNGEGFMK